MKEAEINAMAKTYKTSRLSSARPYTFDDLCKLLETSRWTVEAWVEAGLRLVHESKPRLVRAEDLKAFLKTYRSEPLHPLAAGELRCMHCKAGRRPFGNMVDYTPGPAGSGRISALCETCGSPMSAYCSAAKIGDLREIFDLAIPAKSKDLGARRI